jgi:hypothetical protein
MVRYADDFVILCRTRSDADAALEVIRSWVADNGLTLHPEKTHVGDCRQPGQGFEFVMPEACLQHDGYRFEAGKRFVRKKSLTKLKEAIRVKTRRTRRAGGARGATRQPRDDRRGPQSDASRLVRLLQAGLSDHLPRYRWVYPAPIARAPAQTGKARRLRLQHRYQQTLAQCLLRNCRAVRTSHSLDGRETVSMK